jgi:hypothetical protein
MVSHRVVTATRNGLPKQRLLIKLAALALELCSKVVDEVN